MRTKKGKLRNRRHVQKLGPLVIYDQDQGVTKAFWTIPGHQGLVSMSSRLNFHAYLPFFKNSYIYRSF